MHYSNKEAILVVPIVAPDKYQGSLPSSANVFRLLREVNMYLHFAEGMPLGLWLAEDVGRVAISGFSFGVTFVKSVLDDTHDKSGNPPGFGQEFQSSHLREVYDFDGNVGLDFLTSLARWKGKDTDRRWRLYNGLAASMWAEQVPRVGGFQRAMRFGGYAVREGHNDDGRSMVVLPHEFTTNVLTGIPDAHQWYPTYFVAHAMMRSGFADARVTPTAGDT
jgi:hypothetical protein